MTVIALPAQAALKKYAVRSLSLAQFDDSSPAVEMYGRDSPPAKGGSTPSSVVTIDETGADPVLKRMVWITGGGGETIIVPTLSGGFIWINTESTQGPSPDQVGTGSTSSSITWGDVAGWTITGGTFCHAAPSYVCSFALVAHDATADPPFNSTHYDIGTWTFHGTGFTANTEAGWIYFTSTSGIGNQMILLRGAQRQDGTVPALPLLGIGAVGVSVLAMGVASVRRRRE